MGYSQATAFGQSWKSAFELMLEEHSDTPAERVRTFTYLVADGCLIRSVGAVGTYIVGGPIAKIARGISTEQLPNNQTGHANQSKNED